MKELFDAELSNKYFNNIDEIFVKISKSFLNNYKSFNKVISRYLRKKKTRLLFIEFHSLRGLSLSLGSRYIYKTTEKILLDLDKNIIPEFKIREFLIVFNKFYKLLKEEVEQRIILGCVCE